MGIITKGVKFAIPFGFLHYTNKLELWHETVGSPDAEQRLVKQKEQLNSYTKMISSTLESNNLKLPETNLTNLNLKQYWNCAIYTTFNALANFDAKKLFNKSINAINGLLDQTDKKESTVDK